MACANQTAGRADVVVIGGGLAGSACAIELVRNGIKVTLLERTPEPSLKVCGDFLSGEALDCLEFLGVDAGNLKAHPIHRFALSAGPRTAHVALPFRAAGLTRFRLDATLLAEAADRGVTLMRGVSATGLRADGRQATISIGDDSLQANAVVLATGKHNLRGWQRPQGVVTAFKMQFSLTRTAHDDLSGSVKLFLYDGGHAGACLTEDGTSTVCWQIDTEMLQDFGNEWRDQLAAIARRSPVFGSLLVDAKPIQPRPVAISNLPFGFIHSTLLPANVYPVGDQIAVIPSFTGDGTALALSSGIRAARALVAGQSCDAYRNDFAGQLRRQFAAASATSKVMRSKLGRAVGIETVRMFPSLISRLARATRHSHAVVDRASTTSPL